MPFKVRTHAMNWKETPICSSSRPVFSPKDLKEAENIFSVYKLEKAIYTDYKRVNKSMFYRNNGFEIPVKLYILHST